MGDDDRSGVPSRWVADDYLRVWQQTALEALRRQDYAKYAIMHPALKPYSNNPLERSKSIFIYVKYTLHNMHKLHIPFALQALRNSHICIKYAEYANSPDQLPTHLPPPSVQNCII